MKLTDFFRTKVIGIFVDNAVNGKGAFDNLKTDYVLSRALYASAPADNSGYLQYALGNYCTKTYIDTFSSFIGTPTVSAESGRFTADVTHFFTRNKTTLLKIYRQTMIDGKHFVWLRLEKGINDKPKLAIKQIPFEQVKEEDCIKNADDTYVKFVIETTEQWQQGKDDKKAKVRIELTAGKETITVEGDLPPYYHSKEEQHDTLLNFVPVFCLYNNKLTFMKDGIPEIAAAVPFIRRYDAVLRKLGKHIDGILDPKMKVKVKQIDKFLQGSFGLTPEAYSKLLAGGSSIDITQFKAAMLADEHDDVSFVTQPDTTPSALELLKLLHWIIIELTMPEYLYGTALSTTNASVKEQSPVWAKKIEDRQGEYTEFYYWLLDAFYAASIALNGRDIYAQDGGCEAAVIGWPELTAKDDIALMGALNAFVEAMDKAMMMGLLSPQTAFNTLKTFIAIPNDYTTEREAAGAWLKVKLQVEALQERMRSGDIDAGDAIAELMRA